MLNSFKNLVAAWHDKQVGPPVHHLTGFYIREQISNKVEINRFLCSYLELFEFFVCVYVVVGFELRASHL
jgi:hypothetical protein